MTEKAWTEEERNTHVHILKGFALNNLDALAEFITQKGDDEDMQALVGWVVNAVNALTALGDRRLIPDQYENDTVIYALETSDNIGGR
jgi:hypothetical protein